MFSLMIPILAVLWEDLKKNIIVKYLAHNIPLTGLFWWLSSKELACDTEDTGGVSWFPEAGRSPGGEHGHTFQCSWRIPWTEETRRPQSIGSQSQT